MRYSGAVVTTRDLDVVERELSELKLLGSEDALSRWRRDALKAEQARAREKEKDRRLTDAEAAWQNQYVEQLVDAAKAEIYKHIASLQDVHVEALGEVVGKKSRKMRDELQQHIDEQLAKLRTGPPGARGERGAKGEYGARGPEGKEGPRGKPGVEIATWKIDKTRYVATPILEDGSPGPDLELRSLFEQFVADMRR